MLYREIIAVCSEIHTKHINTVCGQNVELLNVKLVVESHWNVMAQGDARQGNWRGNWRMAWVASTLYTASEHGISNITTADAHTSAASSRLNWGPCRIKWTRPFRRKTKSVFCACFITFQLASTYSDHWVLED
jgi:hypothetical protein